MKRIFSVLSLLALTFACAPSSEGGSESEPATETQQNEAATESDDMGSEATMEATEGMTEGQEVSLVVKTTGETMTDMQYDPARLEVSPGAVVTLILENTAESEAMIHNIVIIKPGKQTEVAEAALIAGPDADYVPENENIIAATGLAKPGETVELKFNAPSKAGTYQFICTYPGHTAMKGIFLVK